MAHQQPQAQAKKPRPPAAIDQANWLSYFSFHWVQPLLLRGRKQIVKEEELMELSAYDNNHRLTETFIKEWTLEIERKKKSSSVNKRPNMYRVLWRCFGLYFSMAIIVAVLESSCKIAEAVLLGKIIQFFDTPSMTTSQGMAYAVGLFLVTVFHGTMHHHFFFPTMRTGFWIRVSMISIMYRKCLSLSTSSSVSTGTIVNLISNDVQPFENATPFILYAIVGPIETAVILYLLYTEIGVACFAGLLVFAFLMPLQTYFSRHFATIRSKTVNARDERIKTLSDVFAGIELVKLSAWEVPFQEKIMAMRKTELGYIWKANLMRATNMSIFFFFMPLVSLATFVTYWLQGKALTPDKLFVSLTLFGVMRLTMTNFFPKALETMAETRVSIRRITDFLLLPELKSLQNPYQTMDSSLDEKSRQDSETQLPTNVLLEMKNASFSWTLKATDDLAAKAIQELSKADKKDDEEPAEGTNSPGRPILNNLNLTLGRNDLLAVVGPVGCGKSSFCMALLQELPLVTGSFQLGQHLETKTPSKKNDDTPSTAPRAIEMSYSAQSPWIFAGTIRDNILFGAPFDQERYDRVIKCCELVRDLTLFDNGDQTIIGEKGVTLSGGQRARVSLARASYKDSDLYILDDPLSAVDPRVGRALFENCINGLLKNKTVVLVTHQLQFIKDCKSVIVLEHGRVTHQGDVQSVMQEEVVVERQINDGQSIKSVKVRSKFVDVLREFARQAIETPEDDEELASDKVLDAGGIMSAGQPLNTDDEKIRPQDSDATINEMKDLKDEDYVDQGVKDLTTEELQEGETPMRVYYDFFRVGSPVLKLIILVLSMAGSQAVLVATDFFVSNWSSYSPEEQAHAFYPTVFGLFVLSSIFACLFRSFLYFHCVASSSKNIFSNMLDALLRTDIDFFHANPHGRILNRFSKDMANCDELLPYTFFDATQIAFQLVGSVVVVAIVNPWVIIAVPFLAAAFVGLRTVYIKTTRQIKRIDGVTRSPIYSQLSETLDGLTSVRAYGAGERFMATFVLAQESNSRAFFIYLGSARWLGFRLDFLAALFLGATAISCVAVRDTQQSNLVGLALNYVLALSSELQWAVRQSVEAAILMVSVERMMEYSAVKPELSERRKFGENGQSVVPNGWPSEAKITFKDMSLTYPRGDKPVLKNISLEFRPHEKVGIVGRTGAGKSSLIAALFRLVEPTTENGARRGGVFLDGLELSELGVHDLRDSMAIIPQEPFMFRGTIRFNLDPIRQKQDADIWAALEIAEMKHVVEKLDGGLDAVVEENGKNFSTGERQLLSLARALLRRAKICVADEMSANVDIRSDRLIQKAIHEQFKDSCVIIIAHRLATVIEYDRVVVLDQGEVKEFGEPWELLNNPEVPEDQLTIESGDSRGWFKRMVSETGAENEAALRLIAEDRWKAKHQSGGEVHH